MTTPQGILEEIRASIDDGARLSHVGSTDDRLVLVLGDEQGRVRYRLDAEATRSLLEEDLAERLTDPRPKRTGALVKS